MDEREKERYRAYVKAKCLSDQIIELSKKMGKLKIELSLAQDKYNQLDRELIMEKKTVLKPQGETQTRIRPKRDFTIEEIKEIARKLKITINI